MDKLYFGIDLGTDSLGFAATDENYNVVKFKGKRIIGTRLFDEAKTGADRRKYRTNVRRLARRKERVQLLQSEFSDNISKIDFNFFNRLAESKYHLEDRDLKQPNTIFNDKDYQDKDYHKDFPTIYHLRKALVEGKQLDARFVYLAIEHMMKNRGHFLFDSIGENGNVEFDEIYNTLYNCLEEKYGLTLECGDIEGFKNIIKDRSKSKSVREKELIGFLNIKNDKQLCTIVGLICGSKKKLNNIYNTTAYSDSSITSIGFSESFDDKEDDLRSILGDDYDLIEITKAIYDWSILDSILNGKKYISEGKCEIYEKHKSDLDDLKKLVYKYFGENTYDKVFKISEKGVHNYAAYSGVCKIKGQKTNILTKCTQEEFCKYIKKLFEDVDDENDEVLTRVKNEVENGLFMPKQTGKDNSIIPYQVNLFELKKILENASKYLDFLNDRDENGLSVSDRIIKIFTFRIPYYVGPLNSNSEKAWIERKKGEIKPWNFEEMVDIDKSAEKFITNMTNKCTYIRKEDVIPKNSLLYSKYTVLNELNNLKIDGEKISVELKQDLFNNLFMRNKKVSRRLLVKYLKSFGIVPQQSKGEEISGIDGDFKSNLAPYIDFRLILDKYKDERMVEDIIKSIVLFGDDRKLLKNRIIKRYGDVLSEDDICYVCKLKYKEWGRFSEKLLNGISYVDKSTGEVLTIIDLLYRTNDNFMQIIYGKYGFLEIIEGENGFKTDSTLEQMIDDMHISPSVKRPVYQTISVINEVMKVLKKEPDKIFVEVTRKEDEKKTRKDSRKKKLEGIYNNCKKDSAELYNQLKNTDDKEFKRDKLYLYYTQMGKCMYSGETISLEDLYTTKYDIDHIFPRSKVKDDSIDNRVLVKREENSKKGNNYPLSAVDSTIQSKMHSHWKRLKELDLISSKKYERLTRTHGFSDDELNDFVARQLVQTSQSTKAVCELLKAIFPNSAIVYSKASNVSDFRHDFGKVNLSKEEAEKYSDFFDEMNFEQKMIGGKTREIAVGYNYDFIKCRDINDYHHAKDAYLNIAVGNVYDEQLTRNKAHFIERLKDDKVSVNRLFKHDIPETWKAGYDGSIAVIKKELSRNDILFTRYCTEKHGELFDLNPLKKGKGQLSLKSSDERMKIDKYGGYNALSVTYFFYAEYDKGKRKERRICPVLLHLKDTYEAEPIKYCEEVLNLKNPKILVKKIKIDTLVKINGCFLHLSSRTENRIAYNNAMQLVISPKWNDYVKNLSGFYKRIEKNGKQNGDNKISEFDRITKEENEALFNTLSDKLNNTMYKKIYSTMAQTVESFTEFSNLSVEQQSVVLMEILRTMRCNAVLGNLKAIGGAEKSGSIKMTSVIYPNKNFTEFKLIYQSPTGLFEQEVDLLADDVKPKKRK